jgi:cellulose biosynthesis protein BcsQ
MSIPVVAFFNNKGGVGKTSLVYHLAWMYAELGLNVLAADLDPQANLTAAFVDEERLEELWTKHEARGTIFGAVRPLKDGTGDIVDKPHVEPPIYDLPGPSGLLQLLAGDLDLSGFEDALSESWPKCMDRDARAFRVVTAFWRILQRAANGWAGLILVDLGPNLGAINRAALISADYVVIPLGPDLFSLQGLHNLGPTLRRWRGEWSERKLKNPVPDLPLPEGSIKPAGYVVLQHAVRLDRPVKAYEKWIARIPDVYRKAVLDESADASVSVENDPHCLAQLKHYRSLMPMAQEARKPVFRLTPADGAIGAHAEGVREAYKHFEGLARKIAERTGVPLPPVVTAA